MFQGKPHKSLFVDYLEIYCLFITTKSYVNYFVAGSRFLQIYRAICDSVVDNLSLQTAK